MAAKKSTTKKSTAKKSAGAKKSTAKKSTAKRSTAKKASPEKAPAKKVTPSVAQAVERVKGATTRGEKFGAIMEAAGAAIQKGASIAQTIKQRRRAKKTSGAKKGPAKS